MHRTTPIDDPSAWRSSDLHDAAWLSILSEAHIAELDTALRGVQRRKLALHDIHASDFELPALRAELRSLLDELECGRGFRLIRGLPVERYTEEEAGIIFWGIGTHLGVAAPQNARGDLLGHVKDEGHADFRDTPTLRGYQTRARLSFHTDHVDLVGLLCLRTARSGGLSSIVSSTAIHNELLAHHPALLARLYRTFSYDQRGEQRPGQPPTYRSPVYSVCEDRVSCRTAALDYVFSAQAKTGEPLSDEDRAALDLFLETAARPDLRIDMEFQPGDMQFLHNSVILHARTAYVDHDGEERKRHLLRLWLNVPEGRRPLAPGVAGARRGGVGVA